MPNVRQSRELKNPFKINDRRDISLYQRVTSTSETVQSPKRVSRIKKSRQNTVNLRKKRKRMPPIATSSSYNTLIDITDEHFDKTYPTLTSNVVDNVQVVQTSILLPDTTSKECLRLPLHSSSNAHVFNGMDVDDYLSTIPSIASRSNEILSCTPRHLVSSPAASGMKLRSGKVIKKQNEVVLNVCQGEIAHTTPSQCDVIASGDATTCHIIALRSVSNDAESLTSLAHLDKAGYESCLREMICYHKKHHNSAKMIECYWDEKKDESSTSSDHFIDMDLHIIGGFKDMDGCSKEISTHLLHVFRRIAEEEKYSLRITLRTCAISCMNDDGFSAPIGRGMGIDTLTGEAFLAQIDDSVAGPAMELRACRLWSGANDTLTCIHSAEDSRIVVQPFEYKPFKDIDSLLRLPDDVMLQYCSTSPDCEADTFCPRLRDTLEYMRDVKCSKTFGAGCDEPVVFERSSSQGQRSNTWVKV